MKIRQIIGVIILLGFIIHAFITPVFYVEWIMNFMFKITDWIARYISDAILSATQ